MIHRVRSAPTFPNENVMTIPEPSADQPQVPTPPVALDEGTGLPVLRSWGRLYLFVALVFVLWVALLQALTRMYS